MITLVHRLAKTTQLNLVVPPNWFPHMFAEIWNMSSHLIALVIALVAVVVVIVVDG